MAMLERYKKPGGFLQLLGLIETCEPVKQAKLLDTVATEDRAWAETARAKMLSVERILSWQDETLHEVFGALQDLTVSVTLYAATPEQKTRFESFLSQSRRRKIEDLYGSKVPTPGEISATRMKIIEAVRKMATDGLLRFERFDAGLVIEQNIEDQLARMASALQSSAAPTTKEPETASSVLHAYSPMAAHQAAATKSEGSEARTGELQALKKKILELSKENAMLRHELTSTKSKLDQIKSQLKKIA